MVLIEEVLVNIINPGDKDPVVVNRMAQQLVRFQDCWMQDLAEMVFQELVEGKPLLTFMPPSVEFLKWSRAFPPGDPQLRQWAEQRKSDRKHEARKRKQEQDRLLLSARSDHVNTFAEFFHRTVRPDFMAKLSLDEGIDLLEAIFGNRFRRRHPGCAREIREAFARYPERYQHLPITTGYISVRLAYHYAPIVDLQPPGASQPSRILGSTTQDQINNPSDEEYVVCSLVSERLLTGDRGMDHMATLFREVGFSKCQSIFFPRENIADQIPALLV